MKIFSYLLLLIFLVIASSSFAQSNDSLKKIYDEQTIYHFGNRFLKGTTVLTYQQLAGEFNTQRTLQLYQISKRKAGIGRIFNLGSVAVFIVSLFTKTNTLGSIGFAAGAGALSLTGYYFQTQSNLFVERALWEHNQQVLFGH